MVDRLDPALGFHRGDEIAHIAGDVGDGRVMRDVDQGVLIDLSNEITQVRLNIQPFQSGLDPPCHAAELRVSFHQVDLESLLGQVQGRGHSGHASADHQAGLVDRQIELLQGFQIDRAGDRHADDVLGLLGGFFLLFGVDPGAMLADIGHVEEVLVDAPFAEGVPEQRLVGPRGAGGDNHAVEPLFPNRVGDLLRGVRGADEEAFLGVRHIGPDPASIRPARGHRRLFRCWRRSDRQRPQP